MCSKTKETYLGVDEENPLDPGKGRNLAIEPEKEKRVGGQKNRSRSHGIGDVKTDGQSRPLAVRIKRHKDGRTVIFSDPEGLW